MNPYRRKLLPQPRFDPGHEEEKSFAKARAKNQVQDFGGSTAFGTLPTEREPQVVQRFDGTAR